MRSIIKRFLVIFLPLAVVFISTILYVRGATSLSNRAVVEASEAKTMSLDALAAESIIKDIVADLYTLAHEPGLESYMLQGSERSWQELGQVFANFASYKKRYSQLCLLNAQGMEMLHINHQNGAAKIVPRSELQSESGRGYFRVTINLGPEQIFISSSDINAPRSTQQIIRFSMPLFAENESKIGIIVMDYTAQDLIDILQTVGDGLLGELLLLNQDSYWLASTHHGQANSGNPAIPGQNFAQAFPEAWQQIVANGSGQTLTAQGLFTFTTLFPYIVSQSSLNQKTSAQFGSDEAHSQLQYHWHLVSWVNAAALQKVLHPSPLLHWVIMLVGTTVLAILSWIIAQAQERRTQMIIALESNKQQLVNQLGFTKSLMDSIPAPLFFKDIHGRYLGCNAAYEEFSGIPANKLIGKTVYDTNPPDLAAVYATQDQVLFKQRGQQMYECEAVFADGSRRDIIFRKNTFTNHLGELSGLIGVMLDITERKQMEEQIRHLAQHDALTGLPNRNLLQDRYQQCCFRAEREQHLFSILMMDLDGFKQVNDTLGHDRGDNLLQQVAYKLKQCIRKTDSVYRLGGDEFVVLLDELHQREDARRVAELSCWSLSQPFKLEPDGIARIGVSIGIAIYPQDGLTIEALMKAADVAMYRAKAGGRNRYEFFSD